MAKLAVHQEEKARHSRFGYYELILFAFLLFEFLLLTFNRVADSNTRTAYLLTYEFGFNAQSLIGSVLSVFTDTITARLIYGLSVVSFLVLAAQISLLLGRLIRNTLPAQQSSVILLCLLFLASPLSITYLLSMNTGVWMYTGSCSPCLRSRGLNTGFALDDSLTLCRGDFDSSGIHGYLYARFGVALVLRGVSSKVFKNLRDGLRFQLCHFVVSYCIFSVFPGVLSVQ